MIGIITSSSQKTCQMKFKASAIPKIGEWVKIGDCQGIIEKIYYDKENWPCAQLSIHNTNDVWGAPIIPGTHVNYIDELKGINFNSKVCGGYYNSGDNLYPLMLDIDYLIGLAGSHIHFGGISGMGKTSYLMWLIHNIINTTKKDGPSTACFIVNLKFSDLMNLHLPGELSDKDHRVYETLGLSKEPFKNINYYASNGSRNLTRDDVKPFGYTIDNGLHLLQRMMLGLDDKAKTLEALIEAIKNGRDFDPEEFAFYHNWKSLWTEPPLVEMDNQPNSWGAFHLSTVRRFLRQTKMILEDQNSGLFINTPSDDFNTIGSIVSGISPNETRVLDFSGLSTTEKFVCMHELVDNIFKECTKNNREIPERIILFVDELNQYAPKNGNHPLKKLLLEISERGRSLGISLVSAAQFSSHVHPRIVGNSSTRIVGRLASNEMVKPDYRFVPKAQREWLSMLPKGEFIIDHAPLGKAVKVAFPRPCFHVGEV
jgi:hypothetical protein